MTTANTTSIEDIRAILKEVSENQKKTDRRINRVSRQMGDLHNRFGELAEHLVIPSIHKRFNELGYHFTEVLPGGIKIYGDDGKVKAQVDIMLENDDTVIAIEIKSKVKEKDIEHHLNRMKILRDFRYKNKDNRKIHGAIAGAIFGEIEKKATIEAGFYVVEQTGDTMKIDVPDGFIPGSW